jgi:hypothetical protein
MTAHQENRWHLDKKVPISIIMVLVIQAVSGLWFIADLKKDIEMVKLVQVLQRERDDRQDRTGAEQVALVRADIQELSKKLDRLIEREHK